MRITLFSLKLFNSITDDIYFNLNIYWDNLQNVCCHWLNHATVRLEFKWELNIWNFEENMIAVMSTDEGMCCALKNWMTRVCECLWRWNTFAIYWTQLLLYEAKKVETKKWLEGKVRKLLAKCDLIFVTCATHFIRVVQTVRSQRYIIQAILLQAAQPKTHQHSHPA